MARRAPEIAAGAVVLVVTAVFLVYAGMNTGEGRGRGYRLTADFNSIAGLTPGADVRMAGVKIGRVVGTTINPQTYEAHVVLTVENPIKLPTDTSAVVSTEGILGGSYLALQPGGAETMLKPGDQITITQSATNLEELLGKFIFNVGDLASAVQKTLPKGTTGDLKPGP
jgi:phospholipid/cholesterol/gamma-HCH transport system substrate-binding protein